MNDLVLANVIIQGNAQSIFHQRDITARPVSGIRCQVYPKTKLYYAICLPKFIVDDEIGNPLINSASFVNKVNGRQA